VRDEAASKGGGPVTEDALGFDPAALRAKYARERARRLRPDGLSQYVEVAGAFGHFADDPWADAPPTREPIADEVDVAIVGAGFGGLLTGARLRELGVQRLRLIDKAADVGGTWYWNRYPGIACDVESYVYMPLLEELGYVPSEKYAKGAEIFEHCRQIAERYDLYRDACLQTEVHEIRWEEGDSRWVISTNRGDRIRAKFVSMANGYIQRPKLPGIPGIDSFGGQAFHTSRWDYAYTGAELANLADKRLGLIGTGATAVQCVPHVAAAAQHLYVFQRTPSTVDVRGNAPTDPKWVSDLQSGWQQRRIENFQVLTAGGDADEDLVADAWTSITKKLFLMREQKSLGVAGDVAEHPTELADFAKMEEIRARIDAVVDDPATAQALKPWYGYFCKRPCFHDDYLQTFNRPNVDLVDTHGLGVERITESGVVVDGVEHELDCLIFATGFEVGTDYSRRSGFELIGRDGVTLTEAWRDGVHTLHGVHVRGFPNAFVLSIAQSGFTVNFPYLLDVQATHVANVIARALELGVDQLEASAHAEAAWVNTVMQRSTSSIDRAKSCTPGYYNREGQYDEKTRQGSFFFGGPTEYAETLRAARDDGGFAGLDVSPAPPAVLP
jgi:cation diffusion facilitator CzcD-associated flavoprotein CzcO